MTEQHKCFISFKMEDEDFKNKIQKMDVDMIDKSLKESIDSTNEDYIMKKIREEYLSDSTVTIFLIGKKSNEDLGQEEQKYIIRELQASLYNGEENTRNGILGIVLPNMYEKIYTGSHICDRCGNRHELLTLNDSTVIREFSDNYFIMPKPGCCWSEDDRYCVLTKWEKFVKEPELYIHKAFKKRESKIAEKVTVYSKRG